MPDQATALDLLATDGILRVSYPGLLSADQYAELLEATKRGPTVAMLVHELRELGQRWSLPVTIRQMSRAKPKQE